MDNLTLRYFDAEMRYLREAGKEFADAFPDRAAHLNLDKPGAQDPYVERLFEGFAFLMGRLREKLDDDLPELTHPLLEQKLPMALLPLVQARFMARTLRGEMESYLPFQAR